MGKSTTGNVLVGGASGAAAGAPLGPAGIVVGGLLGAGTGFFSGQAQDEAAEAAAAAEQKRLETLLGAYVPTVDELSYQVEAPEYQMGDLSRFIQKFTPEELAKSKMEGISTDPRLAQAQMSALQQLAEVSEGGFNKGDLAALEQIRRRAAGQAQSGRETALQNMAQRGVAGSGQELVAQLMAGQHASDQAASMGLEEAKMAQARALQAMTQKGQMASQQRAQQFGEQSDIARAQDAINQFNTQNRNAATQKYMDSIAAANLQTAQNKQLYADKGTDARNLTKQVGADAKKTVSGLDMTKRGGVSTVYSDQASNALKQGANQASGYTQMAGGVMDVLKSYLKNKKEETA